MGYNQLKAFMEYNMTDTADSCGTGLGGTITHPTDPVGNPGITARGSTNGIHVSWTYPTVNPHAVAYFILFRATSASVASSVEIARGAMNYYVDTNEDLENEVTYFYWVQSVSINGTIGELVGPASASMRPSIDELVEAVVGRIKESALDQALRDKIDTVDVMTTAFNSATAAASLAGEINQGILNEWSIKLDQQGTLIENETYTRTLENGNLAGSLSVIAAKAEANAAAILDENFVTATAEGVTATAINTLRGTYAGNLGTLQTMQDLVLGDDGLSAMYTVKSSINGYVTGFGLYNDGEESSFLVHADTFAIGAPTPIGEDEQWENWNQKPPAEVYPFAVERIPGGKGAYRIFLNAETVIVDGHIKNAMIGETISSDDYDVYTKGWGIHKGTAATNSTAVFHDIYARGNIRATSIEGKIVKADNIEAGTINADHLVGGAVSKVYEDSNQAMTAGPNSVQTAFTLVPVIPAGMTANLIGIVTFRGTATHNNTNVGVEIRRTRGTSSSVIAKDDQSVKEGFSEGGAIAFSAENVLPGTRIIVRFRNTWSQGTIINGKCTGNMMMTLY